MANPPFDPYGNPIPAQPGAKRISKSDGTSIPIRSVLKLSSDFSTSDDQTGDATALSLANVPGSGTTAGRYEIPILIEAGAKSAVSSWVPTFAAGAYKRLKIRVRSDAASTFTGGVMSLTGLTGTYSKQTLYTLAGAAAGIVTAANWNNDDFVGAPGVFWGEIDIMTGGHRNAFFNARHDNGGTPVLRFIWGSHSDTTHDVTAFSMTFTGGTFTGYTEIWGIP